MDSRQPDIFGGAVFGLEAQAAKSEHDPGNQAARDADKNADVHVTARKTREAHLLRRAVSEAALEKTLEWHFEPGCTYHTISNGDVDSLTFMRVVVKQQRLRYCLLSTWCMAMTDAEEIADWIKRGYIARMDFYVGEIFKAQYAPVYNFLAEEVCPTCGGRVAVFRNHSKVMAGFGERFDFAIASSANVNTNPRCENTTITVSREVAEFYKGFFDSIKSFNRQFDDWRPWGEDVHAAPT